MSLIRRAARSSATASMLLAAVVLGGACGAADGGATSARSSASRPATPAAPAPQQSIAAAALPPCPQLPPVEPVANGLPDLTLPCLGNGPDVRLSDLRGVPTVINVWAAWCTNCDREMPLFARLQKESGDQLRLFGVHYKAPRNFGLQSGKEFGVSFPSAHDEDGDETAAALGAPGPPTTLFVTGDGRVVGRKIGEIRSFEELSGLVRKHLGVAV